MTLVKVNSPIAKTFDGLVNDIFSDMPMNFGNAFRTDTLNFPPVNIVEKNDAYLLDVAVPGMDKADFNVKLDGDMLTISADKKEESTEEKEKYVRREFSHRSFKRTFTLDDARIKAANISARYENGILKVTLPKKDEVKAVTKEISIS